MKNGVALFYVRCPACGVVAPPRSVDRTPLDATMLECAACGKVNRFERPNAIHANRTVRCARRLCHARFLVPKTAQIIRCPRCKEWQDGPARPPSTTAA